MEQSITISDMTLARDGTQVFDAFDLLLNTRRTAIVGRNGSGKSSLLRVMAGLLPPKSGQVRVNGIDIARDRAAALNTVGILFQNPDHQIIFPTVIEEISFGLEQQGHSRREARDIAATVLADAGRADWADTLCHALSQGQRQMVCLMAILAMEPAWILFDEPFASLDLPSTLRIESRIADLAQNVVTITHDPLRVTHYDRVIWLEAGKIAADGTPADVLPAYTARMHEIAGSEC